MYNYTLYSDIHIVHCVVTLYSGHCVYFKCVHCMYIDIACIHCIVTLYACIVTLCTLYNFSQISDTVLTLHSNNVYGEHSITIQCGTVSVLYI